MSSYTFKGLTRTGRFVTITLKAPSTQEAHKYAEVYLKEYYLVTSV